MSTYPDLDWVRRTLREPYERQIFDQVAQDAAVYGTGAVFVRDDGEVRPVDMRPGAINYYVPGDEQLVELPGESVVDSIRRHWYGDPVDDFAISRHACTCARCRVRTEI